MYRYIYIYTYFSPARPSSQQHKITSFPELGKSESHIVLENKKYFDWHGLTAGAQLARIINMDYSVQADFGHASQFSYISLCYSKPFSFVTQVEEGQDLAQDLRPLEALQEGVWQFGSREKSPLCSGENAQVESVLEEGEIH